MPKININHADIYYELQKSKNLNDNKDSLVLISGFGCDHSIWLGLLDYLTPHFNVLLIDNRGSGQTTCNEENSKNFSIETLADDIMGLVAELGINKPHIIGHSMGGSIAQTLASKYSNKISKMILLNTSSKTNPVSIFVLSSLIKLQEKNVDLSLIIDAFIPWSFSGKFLSELNAVNLHKKIILEYPFPQTLEGNQQQLKALENYDGQTLIQKIEAPTLIVGMERDLLVSLEEIKFLNQNIKHSQLLILPGSHMTIFEEPLIGSKIILDFLH
jgi:pimeloyl-ACP methyl ester carboxylesterase